MPINLKMLAIEYYILVIKNDYSENHAHLIQINNFIVFINNFLVFVNYFQVFIFHLIIFVNTAFIWQAF